MVAMPTGKHHDVSALLLFALDRLLALKADASRLVDIVNEISEHRTRSLCHCWRHFGIHRSPFARR